MSKVMLGVSGGIAAYKACDIISGLQATGHEVRVIMTESAKRFITEESLSVISQHKVYTDDNRDLEGHVTHIDMAKWADVFVVAPATANTLNKLKNNYADNFLTTFALAFTGTNIVVPAMNVNMYARMEETIKIMDMHSRWNIIYPVEGKMACGDFGMGKLPKPRSIVEQINQIIGE